MWCQDITMTSLKTSKLSFFGRIVHYENSCTYFILHIWWHSAEYWISITDCRKAKSICSLPMKNTKLSLVHTRNTFGACARENQVKSWDSHANHVKHVHKLPSVKMFMRIWTLLCIKEHKEYNITESMWQLVYTHEGFILTSKIAE